MARHSNDIPPLNTLERRAAVGLAGIYASRMFGLFLILPVFALHAEELAGATPLTIGLAVGAYGLTQALLQIPFGTLSDRIGRKPVIFGGLILFAIGSVVAALASSIEVVILGRILQGSGAVAAAVMALTADLTREEVRTRAMAGIGISIGISFAIALVAGPALAAWVGVAGIFWLTAALALTAMAILAFVVPTPKRTRPHRDAEPIAQQLIGVLGNGQLLRLDLGVLILHSLMTAIFLVLPLSLVDAGVAPSRHWMVYLPVLLASMIAMVPFIIIAERAGRMKQVLIGAVAALSLALLGLWRGANALITAVPLLILFFTAFNLLEAALPSLISKIAPIEAKGSAMGMFSSSQFFGAFLGGLAGGWIHGALGPEAVYLLGVGGALIWLVAVATMADPRRVSNRVLRLGSVTPSQAPGIEQRLLAVPGVVEVMVAAEDGVAYLKVDQRQIDQDLLDGIGAEAVRTA